MDTPSPRKRGILGMLFSKSDSNDKTPTGPLFTTRVGDGKPEGQPDRQRRCCGLSFRVFMILLIIIMFVALAATIAPLLILRGRKPVPTELSASQCQANFPCRNGGASILVNDPSQCACLCAAGFSGSQCQIRDSSCVAFSTEGVTNTSIGSAIDPLIKVAAANFSNQFTLSPQRIVERFAASNVSCTSQNSLVNLNGSNTANFKSSWFDIFPKAGNVVAFEAWVTTTITTTISSTFTATISFVTSFRTTSFTTFSTSPTTITSRIPTSTFSMITQTVSATPSATSSATGISSEGLVFGRCVILAVVQDFGVRSAATIQRLLEEAVNRGTNTVQDSASGLTVDLSRLVVSGLPKNG
jgi:hypothetical protein